MCLSGPPHSCTPNHSNNRTPNTPRAVSRHFTNKMPESVKVTSVAGSSIARPDFDGPMDTLKEALDSCHYLLSESWVDHYSASKTGPYIDLGLKMLHGSPVTLCWK